jgi:hypothetical protein
MPITNDQRATANVVIIKKYAHPDDPQRFSRARPIYQSVTMEKSAERNAKPDGESQEKGYVRTVQGWLNNADPEKARKGLRPIKLPRNPNPMSNAKMAVVGYDFTK